MLPIEVTALLNECGWILDEEDICSDHYYIATKEALPREDVRNLLSLSGAASYLPLDAPNEIEVWTWVP
jgi:hypothetical protein